MFICASNKIIAGGCDSYIIIASNYKNTSQANTQENPISEGNG